MIEGSGSVPLTNDSGSGSRRQDTKKGDFFLKLKIELICTFIFVSDLMFFKSKKYS
jgi:hypothetical protein